MLPCVLLLYIPLPCVSYIERGLFKGLNTLDAEITWKAVSN